MVTIHLIDSPCTVSGEGQSRLGLREFLELWNDAPTVAEQEAAEFEFCTKCVKSTFRYKSLGFLNDSQNNCMNQ